MSRSLRETGGLAIYSLPILGHFLRSRRTVSLHLDALFSRVNGPQPLQLDPAESKDEWSRKLSPGGQLPVGSSPHGARRTDPAIRGLAGVPIAQDAYGPFTATIRRSPRTLFCPPMAEYANASIPWWGRPSLHHRHV